MSNAAHPVATQATPRRAPSAISQPLPLPSTGAPVTVGVIYDATCDTLVFSLNGKTGTSLSWQAGGYALVINFVWKAQPFDELFAKTPACWFASAIQQDIVHSQICCVPPVPGWYHIAAEVPDREAGGGATKVVDPVIVVTPIITT
jgi:hypothetical protein